MIIKYYSCIFKKVILKFLTVSFLFFGFVTSASATSVMTDTIYTPAEAKVDADQDGSPDLMDERVTVAGIATVGTGLFHEEYLQVFIQHNGNGISLFAQSVDKEILPGDSVVATGVVQDYEGLTEINVDGYEVFNSGRSKYNALKLQEVFRSSEDFESVLVEGNATIIDQGDGFNGKYLTIIDPEEPADTLMAYVSNFHTKHDEFKFNILGEGDNISLKGVLGAANAPGEAEDEYQKIFLRTTEDLEYASIPNYYIKLGILGLAGILLLGAGAFLFFKKEVGRRTFSIKRSLKQKEMLLQEIHHRVKNNLAIISGLIEMQIYTTDDEAAKQVLRDSQNRIKSMAMVHEKLYNSESLSNVTMDYYIKELVEAISNTFQKNNHVAIELDLDPVELSAEEVVPCGLLINEIVVNAFKHAFQDVEQGRLLVSLKQKEGYVELAISDNGSGIPANVDFENNDSLGLMLIKTFTQQLDGEIDIESDDSGTTFRVTFNP